MDSSEVKIFFSGSCSRWIVFANGTHTQTEKKHSHYIMYSEHTMTEGVSRIIFFLSWSIAETLSLRFLLQFATNASELVVKIVTSSDLRLSKCRE